MTALVYLAASLAEIGGCFAFWAWARLGKSPLWLALGILSLVLFAWLLTRVESDAAGRAYAAYGGIYICASLVWLWAVEGASGRIAGMWAVRHSASSARVSFCWDQGPPDAAT